MDESLEEFSKKLNKMIIDAYEGRARFARIMASPGVSFSLEQEKLIRELVEKDEIADAQKMILNKLKTELEG